jgi:hypothetical protein
MTSTPRRAMAKRRACPSIIDRYELGAGPESQGPAGRGLSGQKPGILVRLDVRLGNDLRIRGRAGWLERRSPIGPASAQPQEEHEQHDRSHRMAPFQFRPRRAARCELANHRQLRKWSRSDRSSTRRAGDPVDPGQAGEFATNLCRSGRLTCESVVISPAESARS